MNDLPRPTWTDNWTTLQVHESDLRPIVGKLPPEVEMRVLSIMRLPNTTGLHHLTVGDGPFNVTRLDQLAVAEALRAAGHAIEAPELTVEEDYGWQTESYTPQDAESTELLQLIYDTGLMALVNAAVLHFHGLALGVRQEDGKVDRLDLHRTADPEGVWFDEELTRVGRQKLLKAGLILGGQSPEATAPGRYRLAQEARDAAAALAGTPEGERAATQVELGDLKTIARDRGWDLAFDWVVAHQDADAQ